MLVLSRKVGESLVIDGNIRVVVHRVAGNRVTIGIEAPNHVRIIRGELELHEPEMELVANEEVAADYGRSTPDSTAVATLPRRRVR